MEFAPQDSAHTSQCDLCWAPVVPDSTASWFLISSFFPVYVSEAAQVVQVIFKCLPGPSGLRAGQSSAPMPHSPVTLRPLGSLVSISSGTFFPYEDLSFGNKDSQAP